MGKSLKPPELFASQLIHLGYGHPLWYPEPDGGREVEIGDVGYITDGSFRRLFNSMHNRNHAINRNGVPAGFVPLRVPEELRQRRPNVVKPREPLCSDSVKTSKIGISAEVSA